MSLRRQINKAVGSDPILPSLQKKLVWQWEIIPEISLPKRIPQGTAQPIKISMDNKIYYEDANHVYFTEDRKPLISVTTLLGSFKPPFKAQEMSKFCAEKEDYETNCLIKPPNWDNLNVSARAELIRKAWEENRKQAADYGTFIHACLEHQGRHPTKHNMDVVTEMKSRFNTLVEPLGNMVDIAPNFIYEFIHFWYNPKFRLMGEVLFEPILYDLDIGIAGQSDVVILDHKNKKVHIADYKTNKHKPGSENDVSYTNLFSPLSHLFGNDISIYKIQICLYQSFLVKQLGYGYGTNWILWLNRETGRIEDIPVDPVKEALNVRAIYQYMLDNRKELYDE